MALRLDALRKSHVLAAHLDLQYTLDAVCICMQLCGPGCPAGAIADERIIDCVSMPIAGGQFAAIQRLVPQNRKKVGYGVIAYTSTLSRPGLSQVFLKGGMSVGADLIDTGRYGFARCPCGRAEQGYQHRQDGAAARAKSAQLNRRGDLTEHARDRHSCGDGDPLQRFPPPLITS